MGVAVSNWRLARAVSHLGQLGVVSGTIIGVVLARRLQQGDPGGHMRRALAHFPIPAVAERVMRSFFVEGGKAPDAAFKAVPMPGVAPSAAWTELNVAGGFAEVFLAREGHDHPVGINLLEKIQVATLASLFGAMLAGVGYVIMGAGIPRLIPGALDRFAVGEPAELKVDTEGAAPGAEAVSRFDPQAFFEGHGPAPRLERPRFIAIVSSATLAITLARKSNGRVDGFVVESEVAGGHNAPPRGPLQLSPAGEPVYGPRDAVDFAKIRELGLPFWRAGSRGDPEGLAAARALGAEGIQVGTAFAFCEESGIEPHIRRQVLQLAREGGARVFTDPLASPTGFPFKVVQAGGTLSGQAEYAARERICDLGYLRQAYVKEDGTLGYRCAAEPEADWVRKGGAPAELAGRKCLCNGLLATVGLAQVRTEGGAELPLITAGDEVARVARFLPPDAETYTAADVVKHLLSPAPGAA
ncbi:MAG: nitronate monooxygenase [Opitutaceae bacterium]|nr:nitronate monooxygenase [Opitutaceae bacterium]